MKEESIYKRLGRKEKEKLDEYEERNEERKPIK